MLLLSISIFITIAFCIPKAFSQGFKACNKAEVARSIQPRVDAAILVVKKEA